MTAEEVSLRDHLEAILAEQNRRLDERWNAQQEALRKATAVLGNALTRDEYEAKHETLLNELANLRLTVAAITATQAGAEHQRDAALKLTGRQLAAWGLGVTALSVLVALGTLAHYLLT